MPVFEHLVQFYDTERDLMDAVVPFLADGLEADEAVLVVASESHRRSFERELELLDVGLEQAIVGGTYVALDATEILRYLCHGSGAPTEAGFDETIGALVHRKLAGSRSLRAYSETVGLLWDEDDPSDALALREMWNQLQEQEEFTLFCGYHGPPSTRLEKLRQICRPDSHVLPAISGDDPMVDAVPVGAWLTPSLKAPQRVRARLRAVLGELGKDDDLIERAVLVASELAANAVVHANTPFRLLVRPLTESVWIGVEDGVPLGNRHDLVGRSPHGLGLVAALALRWGAGLKDAGKIIWAEIPG